MYSSTYDVLILVINDWLLTSDKLFWVFNGFVSIEISSEEMTISSVCVTLFFDLIIFCMFWTTDAVLVFRRGDWRWVLITNCNVLKLHIIKIEWTPCFIYCIK